MEDNKHVFAELFSMLGYFIGFGLILFYSLFDRDNHILLVIGLILFVGLRLLGFGLDKIVNSRKK